MDVGPKCYLETAWRLQISRVAHALDVCGLVRLIVLGTNDAIHKYIETKTSCK